MLESNATISRFCVIYYPYVIVANKNLSMLFELLFTTVLKNYHLVLTFHIYEPSILSVYRPNAIIIIIFASITCEVGEVENSPQGGEDVGRGGAGLNMLMMI